MSLPITLFLNGCILTGEALLTIFPGIVTALAVQDGIILATGSDERLYRDFPGAECIDLAGAFTMPGFNDAHLHLGEAARLLREVSLHGSPSLAAMQQRIREAIKEAEPGAWILGGGWDEQLWPEHQPPTRWDLDAVTGDHPAMFVRIDIHVSVANSAALRIAGIDRNTQDPVGGRLDRNAAGEPTGILREAPARKLVEKHVPAATLTERVRDLRTLLASLSALGITSVGDNSIDDDVQALHAIHAAGGLPLRISEWLPFDAPIEELRERQVKSPQDRFFKTGMLKAFLDGSLGSRTAALRKPYHDAPETSGIALYDASQLKSMAEERAAAGFHLGFHAIGDRALEMAIDALGKARAVAPDAMLRVEHVQMACADDLKKLTDAGIIASVQPSHLLSDKNWIEERIGAERTMDAYRWRTLLDAGIELALGTDLPVEPATPWRTLYAALTRRTETGAEAFHPEECLTLGEALHAYTQGAALAEGAAAWKGQLKPGFVADFVVLDTNLIAAAEEVPRKLLATKVLRTVVGGQTVYLKNPDYGEPDHAA